MSSVEIILDVLELAACVALTYFVFYLYQKEFRSGVMEKGFRMIAISILILAIGQSFDIISAIQTTNELASILTTVMGTAFSLVATYGFFLLYRVWHVDRKEARLEKTINA